MKALLVGMLLLGALAGVTASQVPVFRSGVELVRIEVSVTRGGRPVGGLGFEDFEVRDNDVVQPLNSVLLEQVPLDVYFVLDMSQSVTGPKLADLRRAAGAFIVGLTAEDRAALVCFSQQVALNEPLTGDLARVQRTLETVSGTGSTAMRDALYAAIRLAPRRGGRLQRRHRQPQLAARGRRRRGVEAVGRRGVRRAGAATVVQ